MPPIRFPDGNVVAFPDGTPKETIDQYYQQNFAPRENRLAQAATLAGRFMNARQPAPQSTMPTLAGTNFAFGNQQGVTAVMNAEQNALQDNLRAKMERERMIQQETEAEKSRAAALKLEQIRHKNNLAQAKMEMEYRKLNQKPDLIDVYNPDGTVTRKPDTEGLNRGVPPSMVTTGWENDPATGAPVQTSVLKTPGTKRGTPPSALTTGYRDGVKVIIPKTIGAEVGDAPPKPPTALQQKSLMEELNKFGVPEEAKQEIMREFTSPPYKVSNWDWMDPESETVLRFVDTPAGKALKRIKAGDYVGVPDQLTNLGESMTKAVRDGVASGLVPKKKNGQPDVEAIPKYLVQRGFNAEQIGQFYKLSKEPTMIDRILGRQPESLLPEQPVNPPASAPAQATQPNAQGLVPKVYRGQRGMYNPQTQEFFPDKVN